MIAVWSTLIGLGGGVDEVQALGGSSGGDAPLPDMIVLSDIGCSHCSSLAIISRISSRLK